MRRRFRWHHFWRSETGSNVAQAAAVALMAAALISTLLAGGRELVPRVQCAFAGVVASIGGGGAANCGPGTQPPVDSGPHEPESREPPRPEKKDDPPSGLKGLALKACDKAAGAVLDQLLPAPDCKNGNTTGKIKVDGNVVVGIPKAEGAQEVTVKRNGDGTIEIIVQRKGSLGAEGGVGGKAKGQIGGQEAGGGGEAEIYAQLGILGEQKFKFDPSRTGDMCKAAFGLGYLTGKQSVLGPISNAPGIRDLFRDFEKEIFNPIDNDNKIGGFGKGGAEGEIGVIGLLAIKGKLEGETSISQIARQDGSTRYEIATTTTGNVKGQIGISLEGEAKGQLKVEIENGKISKATSSLEITVGSNVDAKKLVEDLIKNGSLPPDAAIKNINFKGNEKYTLKVEYSITDPVRLAQLELDLVRDPSRQNVDRLWLQVTQNAEVKITGAKNKETGIGFDVEVGEGVKGEIGGNIAASRKDEVPLLTYTPKDGLTIGCG